MKTHLRTKAVCGILIMALALTLAAGLISYRVYAGAMDNHYRMMAKNIAQTAADVMDKSAVRKYTDAVKAVYLADPAPEFESDRELEDYLAKYDGLKDDGYWELFRMLEKIKLANGVVSLYISYMDPESMTGVYILDADNTETGCPAGTWDIIYPDNYEAMTHPEDGFDAYITDTEEYGWLCSAGVAVPDEDGQVIAHVFVDISMDSVMHDRQSYLTRLCAVLVLVTAAMVCALLLAVNRAVVRPINALAAAAGSYMKEREDPASGGVSALARLDIRTGDEVENLSHAMKQMEEDINLYIRDLTTVTAEKERIGAELDIATHIQSSMLPCIFPAFPERPEVDIYATMDPAKEVGGDFYDFFMVDDTHLAIVVADVSGKGVPAALFMVIGKTLIKDHTTPGRDLGEVFMEVNKLLCEGNGEELFITAFEGVLDLETGQFNFVNAGHEMPFIRRRGQYTPEKIRAGFVLAGMEMTRYRMGSLQLEPGDAIFQYTDGVTEATNANNELYGMERLEAVLNRNADAVPGALLPAVKADIDAFVGDAPQFDDITMLCLEFKKMMNTSDPNEMTVEASLENIPAVTAFVDERLEELDCPIKAQMQIDVAIDELFSNIARYAYDPATGPATVRVDVDREPLAVRITFIDHGKPYDPLAKDDPDVTLSAEERQIGGLGIFMVKKTMDDVRYEYRDGQNILTVEKRL